MEGFLVSHAGCVGEGFRVFVLAVQGRVQGLGFRELRCPKPCAYIRTSVII